MITELTENAKSSGAAVMLISAFAIGWSVKIVAAHDAFENLRRLGLMRVGIWFFLWPGMDGRAFFDRNLVPEIPRLTEWIHAFLKLIAGVLLMFVFAPWLYNFNPQIAAWTYFIGILLTFHFGIFHLISARLRKAGIHARPVMQNPLVAQNLGELWGRRWNTAFSIPARRFVLQPMSRRIGVTAATLLVFLLSGILHELVITLPARGGYGLPTLYFLLQGFGVIAQQSKTSRALNFNRGINGRLLTALVAGLPAIFLFGPDFMQNVIIPLINTKGTGL